MAAMFADCGDVLAAIGLNEMISAYVALSRVKAAGGLLLLRAFAPDLIRCGVSPGPECLLKLLRARFAGNLGEYTPAEAKEEYIKKMALVKLGFKIRKQLGLQMRCSRPLYRQTVRPRVEPWMTWCTNIASRQVVHGNARNVSRTTQIQALPEGPSQLETISCAIRTASAETDYNKMTTRCAKRARLREIRKAMAASDVSSASAGTKSISLANGRQPWFA